MSDDLKKEGLLQCRNLLLDGLMSYIRSSSEIPNEDLYGRVMSMISQIYFIDSKIGFSEEDIYRAKQKRNEKMMKLFYDINQKK